LLLITARAAVIVLLRHSQGQAVIPSGMAWQQHMLVLIMSAKLLADAEAALQMTPDAAGSGESRVTLHVITFVKGSFCRVAGRCRSSAADEAGRSWS
jgi:hypothetical protein